MRLTRGGRIALELLGPTAISSTLILLTFAGQLLWEKGLTEEMAHQLIQYAFLVPIGALMWSGLQSIVSAVFQEWRFKQGLCPASWKAVKLASVLGLLSGGASGVVVALAVARETGFLVALFLGGFGLMVGFILGLLIKFGSAREKARLGLGS